MFAGSCMYSFLENKVSPLMEDAYTCIPQEIHPEYGLHTQGGAFKVQHLGLQIYTYLLLRGLTCTLCATVAVAG